MTWIYKNFIFKPKAKGFTSLGNLLRADPLFEKQLNNFSQLGWEYVQALSLNLGIFAPQRISRCTKSSRRRRLLYFS
jgi:hypothetical protein